MGAEKTIDDPLNLSPEAASTILSDVRGANVVQGAALRLAQEALQQMVADTGRYSTSEALTALNEMVADILDGYIEVQSIELRHRIIENALNGDRARRRTPSRQEERSGYRRVIHASRNQSAPSDKDPDEEMERQFARENADKYGLEYPDTEDI